MFRANAAAVTWVEQMRELVGGREPVTSWHWRGTGHWHSKRLFPHGRAIQLGLPYGMNPKCRPKGISKYKWLLCFSFLPQTDPDSSVDQRGRKEGNSHGSNPQAGLLGLRGRWDNKLKTVSPLLSVLLQPPIYLPAFLVWAGAVSTQPSRGACPLSPPHKPSASSPARSRTISFKTKSKQVKKAKTPSPAEELELPGGLGDCPV